MYVYIYIYTCYVYDSYYIGILSCAILYNIMLRFKFRAAREEGRRRGSLRGANAGPKEGGLNIGQHEGLNI